MRYALAELALCGAIGVSGAVALYEAVQAVSCGERRPSDVLMGAIGAFLIGVVAWNYRRF